MAKIAKDFKENSKNLGESEAKRIRDNKWKSFMRTLLFGKSVNRRAESS
jgi:hypothetical protein